MLFKIFYEQSTVLECQITVSGWNHHETIVEDNYRPKLNSPYMELTRREERRRPSAIFARPLLMICHE